jgi:hypothetical protein
MKDFAMQVSFIPSLNAVQCTIPTADYDKWRQEEGRLVTALSDKVESDDKVTTLTLSVPWFEICKRYCRIC